jgi:hypothetical protein
MEIYPVGAELLNAGTYRQTDTKKLIVAFRNFARALSKGSSLHAFRAARFVKNA